LLLLLLLLWTLGLELDEPMVDVGVLRGFLRSKVKVAEINIAVWTSCNANADSFDWIQLVGGF
jgi:hypothetical protein